MTFRNVKYFLCILALLTAQGPVLAGAQVDAMARCLADNTTGKDRKALARWIFVAMASHPELQGYATAVGPAKEETSRIVAALMTRLLVESCNEETKAALQAEGSAALPAAFGNLGQLAMQELMTNKEVNESISHFERYVDQKKLQSALIP